MNQSDNRILSPEPVRVALVGQPNCGKTSLFNQLTESLGHVANYPGVTVEKREGSYEYNGRTFTVVDLPGTYSLGSFSPEERITEEELIDHPPDVVVVVVDTMAASRSLMLLGQVLLLRTKTVLCMNMADEAERAGLKIDLQQMSRLLDLPVVATVGHRGQGVDDLRQRIYQQASSSQPPRLPVLGEQLGAALEQIATELSQAPKIGTALPFFALRLLAGDEWLEKKLALARLVPQAVELAQKMRQQLEKQDSQDIALIISQRLAAFVDGLLRECIIERARDDARAVSDRLDYVLADRRLGLLIFAGVMYFLFFLTFKLGDYPVAWLEKLFSALAAWLGSLWPEQSSSWLRSLVVDGIIGGVGGVLVFTPNIMLLFLGLALLEDTGYMARAAHLIDHFMHRFGLHGKSFLPMMVGFGCNVPGIMATRIMENQSDRLITILVLPLMSCGARLTIWLALVPAFFPPAWQALVFWCIYAFGVVLALALAWLLRKTVFADQQAPFVMELPPYRLPTLKNLLNKMLERTWLYLRKAGTVILAVSLVMWLITSFPRPPQNPAPESGPETSSLVAPADASLSKQSPLAYSIAGRLGRFIEPVLTPIGLDWKLAVAIIGAFTAKEVFVAQLGIVYSLENVEHRPESLRQALRRDYRPLQGISLIIFMLVAMPCLATVAITRRETGRSRWAALQLGGLTALGYLLALAVYQLGRLL